MGRELKPYDGLKAYAEAQSAPAQTVDIRRLLVALRRQRGAILLPAILLGALGMAYSSSKPETFSAYSSLLLDSNLNRSLQQVSGMGTTTLTAERLENARVVLLSDKLANDVLDRTGLQENRSFMSPPYSPFSAAIGQAIYTVLRPVSWVRQQVTALVSPADTAPPAAEPTAVPSVDLPGQPVADPMRQLAILRLYQGIQVSRIGQSSAMAVRYQSHDPAIAAQVADAYADAYVQDILTSNASSVSQTNAWMRTRLDELQAQAQEAANEAERFAAEHQLVEFSSGGMLTEQALNELNSSLTAALTDEAKARAVLETYQRAVAGGVEGLINSTTSVTISGEVSEELRGRLDSYNSVRARLQRLLATSGRDHSQVRGLEQTVATSAERLFVELQSKASEAQGMLDVAAARVQALQQNVAQASAANSAQAANLVRLRALQEKAATLSKLYQQTLTSSQEIEQQQSFPVANARILSYAQVPTSPSGPAVMRTTLAATLLGLFFGMAIAAWREWRERSLRTAADVTEHSGLRFLGHLPVLPAVRMPRPVKQAAPKKALSASTKGKAGVPVRFTPPAVQVPVPVLHYPDSVYAETLRHVRLAGESAGRPVPVTGVTSFHPYEGRSEMALNLAGQLGVGQQSILLIDADSRARPLSRRLGLDMKPGLTDAVAGRGNWRDMLVNIADTNLYVLPCGLDTGGPSDDLLTGQKLAQIMAEADASDFARIVVDVPPLYPVAQGRAILRELPQFVIVGEWGRTPRAMVEAALAEDFRLESRCIGVVYDRVNLRKLKGFLLPEEVENYLRKSKSYISLKSNVTKR